MTQQSSDRATAPALGSGGSGQLCARSPCALPGSPGRGCQSRVPSGVRVATGVLSANCMGCHPGGDSWTAGAGQVGNGLPAQTPRRARSWGMKLKGTCRPLLPGAVWESHLHRRPLLPPPAQDPSEQRELTGQQGPQRPGPLPAIGASHPRAQHRAGSEC